MSVFVSVIILLLIMLITASLQLAPSTFSIFYHYALGKTTAKKADDRSLSFILGVEIFASLIWVLLFFILTLLRFIIDVYSPLTFWIISGIFFAEAIAFLLFYYRHGHGTALFIPRNTASALQSCAQKANSRSDAIALGFFANFPELIFTLPLYFISTVILLNTPTLPCAPIIILCLASAILPLLIVRILYRSDRNLAFITRIRVRLKPFLRIIIPLLYVALASATLILGVYHG